MNNKVRLTVRGLAVLTAVPLFGAVPVLVAEQAATADGPVFPDTDPRFTNRGAGQQGGEKKGKPAHVAKKKSKKSKKGKGHQKGVKFGLTTGAPDSPVQPGETYSWPFAVSNKGAKTSKPVTFRAPVPSALEYVSAGQNCELQKGSSTSTAVCDLGKVKPGETVAGVLTGTVDKEAEAGEKIESTAEVTWGRARATRAFPSVSIARQVDVSITMDADAKVRPGEPVTYELKVANTGPKTAYNVAVDADLPAGTVETDADCAASGTSHKCEIGALEVGEERTLTLTLTPDADLKPGAVLDASASVTTTSDDTNDANDHATVHTKLVKPGKKPDGKGGDKGGDKGGKDGDGKNGCPTGKDGHHGKSGDKDGKDGDGKDCPGNGGKPDGGKPATPPQQPVPPLQELPRTGAPSLLMAQVSLGLVGGGLVLTRLGRKRRAKD